MLRESAIGEPAHRQIHDHDLTRKLLSGCEVIFRLMFWRGEKEERQRRWGPSLGPAPAPRPDPARS